MTTKQSIPQDPLATRPRRQAAPQFSHKTTSCSVSQEISRVDLVYSGTMQLPDSLSSPDSCWSLQSVKKKSSTVAEPVPTNPDEFKLFQPRLLSIVAEAKARLKQAFGNGAVVREELVVPDDEGGAYPILFLIAQVDLPTEDARRIMRNLDETWWLDQLEAVQGKVQLDFEFR